jgi:hypothetical protein
MRRTVRLPDGYNGRTALFFADPIERQSDTVKLQCAEAGKQHLIRWAYAIDVEEQDDEEPFRNGPDTDF